MHPADALRRWWAPAAAVLLAAIATARIASTYTVFNHTIDEPDTIAPGLEYLSIGKYLYEDTHPPLGRLFAAIGPYLSGERFHPGPESYLEGYRVLGHGAHYDRVLALARMGNLPFFWIACAVVYLWAWRIRGPGAAVAAVLLYTTIPPVLAHAGLATTDMALGAMTPAAALAALWWADQPDRRRSLAFGALAALACCSKFSALVFLPVGLAAIWATDRRPLKRAHGRALFWVLGMAALTVWAVYGFSFARVEFLHLRLPAPRFFSGIHSVWMHNRGGHPAYLLGRRSANGFWYFFPTVLALKTPLALLVLALAAAAACFVQPLLNGRGSDRLASPDARSEPRPSGSRWTAAPLAFSAAVLAVSMTGHIDLGVRYLLPVYTGLAVAAGCLAASVRGVPARIAVSALLVWQIASGARQHPDYLAYTNEIAGGHPEHFLADSDLDWGQDMKRLGDFLAARGVTRLTFSPFNRTYLWTGYPLPPLAAGVTDHPSPGWNAVSVTIWKVFGYPQWADRAPPPDARIGRSILLWYVK